MKILVICDDFWHPGEIVARGLKPLEEHGCELDVVMHARDLLYPAMLRDYDAIINAKSNVFSPANQAPWFDASVTAVMPNDFRSYIEEGHGFLALHAGNCYSRERQADMARLTGNSFLGHPPQCEVRMEPVGEHPIMRNVRPFAVRDEHYCIDVHARDIDLFMTSSSDTGAGTQMAGYTRSLGKGRFCCLTPGHNYSVYREPEFLNVLKNALDWCVGRI
ncbi:MAG: ThuA domain-containing protein [Bacillota bacterium]|nr:ThuA domain-containing protein [Bacillota bacterium]